MCLRMDNKMNTDEIDILFKNKFDAYYENLGKKRQKEAKYRAFKDIWDIKDDNEEFRRNHLVSLLTKEERKHVMSNGLFIIPYIKDLTVDDIKIWSYQKNQIPSDFLKLNPITNPKIRAAMINYIPAIVWWITPRATDHEIFIAIVRSPIIVTYTSYDWPNLTEYFVHNSLPPISKEMQKWLALALVVSLNREDSIYQKIQSLYHRSHIEQAMSTWGPYWHHILGDKNG